MLRIPIKNSSFNVNNFLIVEKNIHILGSFVDERADFFFKSIMDQLTNDTPLIQSTQTTVRTKRKRILCNECNQKKLDVNHQVCRNCYRMKTIYKPSGNKVIDDFIKYTLINDNKFAGKMEFVPYDRFKNVEFIAEGGFSKIYKATWIDGSIGGWSNQKQCYTRNKGDEGSTVVLKMLNNSKEVTSKELNEVNILY